jgi:hypothetical protein
MRRLPGGTSAASSGLGRRRSGHRGGSCRALAHFGEDIDAMMALVDRALALNPNFARGWHASGFLRK